MDDIRLPDRLRLREVRKRIKDLPSQESVDDTSNWENRNVSAPVIDTVNKEQAVRKLDFMGSEKTKLQAVTLNQLKHLKGPNKKKPAK